MPSNLFDNRNKAQARYNSWSNPGLGAGTSGTGTGGANLDMNSIINQAIPGFSGLTGSATDVINNLLNGLPSPSESRRENAYFGAASGLGTSADPTNDFLTRRGFDLYGQKAEKRQQAGLDDLLKFLSTYSGSVVPTTGQQLQSGQFDQELAFRQQQAAIENARADKQAMENQQLNIPWYLRDATHRAQDKWNNQLTSYRGF